MQRAFFFSQPIQRIEAGVDNSHSRNLTLFGLGNFHNCLKRPKLFLVWCDIKDLTVKNPLLSKFQI